MTTGAITQFREYWQMTEAILTAAYIYQVAGMQQESRRPGRPIWTVEPDITAATTVSDLPPTALLKEYVNASSRHCPCGGAFAFLAVDLPVALGSNLVIPVLCRRCGMAGELRTTQRLLEAHFRLPNKSDRTKKKKR